jgi:secreted trypsin-like serine protease
VPERKKWSSARHKQARGPIVDPSIEAAAQGGVIVIGESPCGQRNDQRS